MENNDKWIQNIRGLMEDYSEPLPDNFWEDIQRKLDTPKVVPMWRKWQVAATVAAIVSITSLTIWFWSPSTVDYFKEERIAVTLENPEMMRQTPSNEEILADVRPVSTSSLLGRMDTDMRVKSAESSSFESNREISVTESPDIEKEEEAEAGSLSEEIKEEARRSSLRSRRKADRAQMEYNAGLLRKERHESDRKGSWSLGVLTGNTPYSSNMVFGGFGRLDSRSSYVADYVLMSPVDSKNTAYSQVLFNNRDQNTATKVKHRMPVTFGASVKWNLDEAWGIESGITYTFLSSELHSGSTSYLEEEQKLHYVGIPLKVHRSIWKNKLLALYASAGGMVEKCVSGKQETVYVTGNSDRDVERMSLDVDPLQWSVSGALGAQVNFNSKLGLYVEPGVAYYFNDHSGVETIRKEHPFNFNLQLGLRFSISK